MIDPIKNFTRQNDVEQAAAGWVLRLERGLAPAEEEEFAQWLAADPGHAAVFEEHQRAWDRFEPLAASTAPVARIPAARRRSPVIRLLTAGLAAAAVVAVGLTLWRPPSEAPVTAGPVLPLASLTAPCEQEVLEDGSLIELNRGAKVTVRYTVAERRIRLQQGEAHFSVAKNPVRPFIVNAGVVEVRAVGTAFDVRFDPAVVEVLVTEGKVQVGQVAGPSSVPASTPRPPTWVGAGQAAIVSLTGEAQPPKVAALSTAEMEARLVWEPRMLEYDDASLATIVAEFDRHNPVQLVISDPALGALRMTASFRSDNMEGFVRLIQSNYGIRAERRTDREIVLCRR